MRAYRFAFRPGWLALHLFVVAAMITMIKLGHWQLTVSEHKHFNLQNFGYSIQWWLFSGFAAFMWWRVVRDQVRRQRISTGELPPAPAPPERDFVAYRRYVAPVVVAESEDPVHTAYNDYLSALAASDGTNPEGVR